MCWSCRCLLLKSVGKHISLQSPKTPENNGSQCVGLAVPCFGVLVTQKTAAYASQSFNSIKMLLMIHIPSTSVFKAPRLQKNQQKAVPGSFNPRSLGPGSFPLLCHTSAMGRYYANGLWQPAGRKKRVSPGILSAASLVCRV